MEHKHASSYVENVFYLYTLFRDRPNISIPWTTVKMKLGKCHLNMGIGDIGAFVWFSHLGC